MDDFDYSYEVRRFRKIKESRETVAEKMELLRLIEEVKGRRLILENIDTEFDQVFSNDQLSPDDMDQLKRVVDAVIYKLRNTSGNTIEFQKRVVDILTEQKKLQLFVTGMLKIEITKPDFDWSRTIELMTAQRYHDVNYKESTMLKQRLNRANEDGLLTPEKAAAFVRDEFDEIFSSYDLKSRQHQYVDRIFEALIQQLYSWYQSVNDVERLPDEIIEEKRVELTEDLFVELATMASPERMKTLKSLLDVADTRIAWEQLGAMDLKPLERSECYLIMARRDPELFLRHVDIIDTGEWPDLDTIIKVLMQYSVAQTLYAMAKLKTIDHVYLLGTALNFDPLGFLESWPKLSNLYIGSGHDKEILALIEQEVGKVEINDEKAVEILNRLYNVDVEDYETRQKYSILMEKAIRQLGGAVVEIFDEVRSKYAEAVAEAKENQVDPDDYPQLPGGRDVVVQAIKKMKQLGLERGTGDIIAWAACVDGRRITREMAIEYNENQSYIYLLENIVEQDSSVFHDKVSLADVTKKMVIDDLVTQDSDTYTLGEILSPFVESAKHVDDLRPAVARAAQFLFIKDADIYGSMAFNIVNNKLLDATLCETIFDIAIAKDPAYLIEYSESYIHLQENLTDEQKFTVLRALVATNPYVAARNYYRLTPRNKRQAHEYLSELIAQGVDPFVLLGNPSRAQKILSLPNPGNLWREGLSIVERTALLDKIERVRRQISPRAWDMLQSLALEEEFTEFRWTNIPIEGLLAFSEVVENYPQWIDYLKRDTFEPSEGSQDNVRWTHNREWLMFFINLTPETIGNLGKYIEEAHSIFRKAERKRKEISWLKYKQERPGFDRWTPREQRAMFKKYSELEGDDARLGREKAAKSQFDQVIGVACVLDENFSTILKRIQTLDDYFVQDSQSRYRRFASVDYLHASRQSSMQVKENLVFLETDKESIRQWMRIWGDNFYKKRVLEKIMQLDDESRKYICDYQSILEVSRGFDVTAVAMLMMELLYAKALKTEDKDNKEILQAYLKDFGLWTSPIVFREYQGLYRGGEPSADFAKLGIKGTGKTAINSFRQVMQKIKNDFIEKSTFDRIDEVIGNPSFEEIISYLSNFETSQWARSRPLREVAQAFINDKKQGLIAELPSEYTPGRIKVQTSATEDEDQSEQVQVRPEAQEQYQRFIESMTAGIYETWADESTVKQFCFQAVDKEILSCRRQISKLTGDRDLDDETRSARIRRQERQIESLQALRLELDRSDDLLTTLLQYEIQNKIKFTEYSSQVIQTLVWSRAKDVLGNAMTVVSKLSGKYYPEYSDLTRLIELVANQMKQHVWPKMQLKKEEIDRLNQVFNLRAVEDEIKRIGSLSSKNSEEFTCVPSRDLQAELSGYYCDACWTSAEDIMKDNPHMIGVSFVSTPDNATTKRIVGGSLLIETTAGGDKALIVRGLNPRENVINSLNPEDFVQRFLDYLEPICRARGIKKILFPIHQKGALSNRPALLSYLKGFNDKEKFPVLPLDEEVNFNGYDIKDSCVVLRDLTAEK